ncbi:MAG: discoidin domain-containing protein [Deltaproteobacteria bacterium]|nr:discoidin domain-containing protein [Deltaproteobacteria bacterium]
MSSKEEKKSKSFFRKLVFFTLYTTFIVAIVFGVLAGLEYYAYLKVKASPLGQAYIGRDMDLARRSSQTVAPQYGYEPTPGFAAVRNTRLGNSFEYIDDESFKDFEDVPVEKPENEYRVIVTGGSVVYGRGPVPPSDAICDYYEVTFRWTIPHIIQELMNADPEIRTKLNGKKVRVINAGVAGYVYQNELMRYLAKLRLFNPDLVISLDGANEVHTVARPLKDWNYFTEGPYYEVVGEVMDMGPKGLLNYLTLWLKRNTYFFTWLAMNNGEGPGILMENRGFAAHPQDPTPEMMQCLNNNIRQVADAVAIYHSTLVSDRVPHVFALQPMFRNCKKERTPIEQEIEKVTGMEKIGFYDSRKTYEDLVDQISKRAQDGKFEVVDMTRIFDNTHEWVFTDWCHVTNGANFVIAKALVNEVKQQIFGLPLNKYDKLQNPPDSYFADYSKEAKVLVDNKARDDGLEILKGYPGQKGLEIPLSKPSDVILDLEKVVPVSRLRIVWGSKDTVPKSWKIDISEDGQNWKNWLKVGETKTDHYDQWPGFEYYAGAESPARYVRYSQDNTGKEIYLRQLSLFR